VSVTRSVPASTSACFPTCSCGSNPSTSRSATSRHDGHRERSPRRPRLQFWADASRPAFRSPP